MGKANIQTAMAMLDPDRCAEVYQLPNIMAREAFRLQQDRVANFDAMMDLCMRYFIHHFKAVISQRLRFRPELNIRVPECEILLPTHAVKSFIRNRDFFQIPSSLEPGGDHGMWTLQRYRTWLDNRKNWYVPGKTAEPADDAAADPSPTSARPPAFPIASKPFKPEPKPGSLAPPPADKASTRIEIEPGESEFGKILKRPGE